MGVATLGDHTFRLDPTTVEWDYDVRANDTPCIGGKVVQVFAARLGDMRVGGSFSSWEEQADFLAKIKGWTKEMAQRETIPPVRFLYPPKGWDFLVYISGMSDPAGRRSVTWDNANFVPKFVLSLFIVEDNTGITRVAMDAYIKRLSAGLGWKQSKFNGPLDFQEVDDLVKGSGYGNVQEYISSYFPMPAGVLMPGELPPMTEPTVADRRSGV